MVTTTGPWSSAQALPLGAEPWEAPRACPARTVRNQSQRRSFADGRGQGSGFRVVKHTAGSWNCHSLAKRMATRSTQKTQVCSYQAVGSTFQAYSWLHLARKGNQALMDEFIYPVCCQPHLMMTCRYMSLSWRFPVIKEAMKELIVVDSDPGPQEEPDLGSRLGWGGCRTACGS